MYGICDESVYNTCVRRRRRRSRSSSCLTIRFSIHRYPDPDYMKKENHADSSQ